MEGRVKYFDYNANYGFIQLLDERNRIVDEYFFHRKSVVDFDPVANPLRSGDTVEFLITDDAKSNGRMCAFNVRQVRETETDSSKQITQAPKEYTKVPNDSRSQIDNSVQADA
jgi:cold shock CspA family protein